MTHSVARAMQMSTFITRESRSECWVGFAGEDHHGPAGLRTLFDLGLYPGQYHCLTSLASHYITCNGIELQYITSQAIITPLDRKTYMQTGHKDKIRVTCEQDMQLHSHGVLSKHNSLLLLCLFCTLVGLITTTQAY